MLDIWEVDEWKSASSVFGAKRSNAQITELDKLVEPYHATPGREIEKRMGILDKIVEVGVKFVGEKVDTSKLLSPQAYKRIPAVQQLVAQATAKSGYLDQCLECEKTFPYLLGPIPKTYVPPKDDDKWQAAWQKKIDKVNVELSNLVNFKSWCEYDPKVGGKMLDETYWTEAIDPLSRNLKGDQFYLYEEWNALRSDPKAPLQVGFYRWLEEQDAKTVAEKLKPSKYQDEIGRERYRVWVRNIGKAWRCNDGVWGNFDTQEYSTNFHGKGWAIFVIDAKGEEMYADNHSNAGSNKFYHACFLAGRPVLGAGEIQVRDGVIWRMSPKSGHYKPGVKEILAAIQFFKSHNVPLDKGFEVSVPASPPPNKLDGPEMAKFQFWYQADWFLKQKGEVDPRECAVVAENRPLKPKEVKMTQVNNGSIGVWNGADMETLEQSVMGKDPWLRKARGK